MKAITEIEMKQKTNLKDILKIYSEFSYYENIGLSKKEILYAAKKFAEVAHGSLSDEYIRDYSHRHNYFSQDTYTFMENNPWSVMNEYKSQYFEDCSDTFSTPMKSINMEEMYA